MRLENKVAIITGGSRGIGRAIALLFAREGADVVVTYKKSEDEAGKVVEEIEGSGCKGLAVQYDAGSNFDEVVEKTIDAFGRVDILVNNAGILIAKPFEETTPEIWNKTISVNLTAVGECILKALPHMPNGGKIVNISSISGIVGSLTSVPYAASKAGVDAITKTLSKSLGEKGITINSIAPGPVKTDMARENLSPELIEKLAQETPMGRIAEPEDVAKAALFFASSDSDFVTGQTLIVDGGRIVK